MTYRYNKTVGLLALLSLFLLFDVVQGQTVMEELKNNRQTTLFAEALEKANLDDRLENSGPFTLFAPSNQAFELLTSTQQSNEELLLNHIFIGMATERSLEVMSDITCLSGKTISIQNEGQQLLVNSSRIINSNIRADNGVIHIIDGVIN